MQGLHIDSIPLRWVTYMPDETERWTNTGIAFRKDEPASGCSWSGGQIDAINDAVDDGGGGGAAAADVDDGGLGGADNDEDDEDDEDDDDSELVRHCTKALHCVNNTSLSL